MFIGWLTCIPAVLLPHSLCRSTTANAPANRQMPIASVVMGKCRKKEKDMRKVFINYIFVQTTMRNFLILTYIMFSLCLWGQNVTPLLFIDYNNAIKEIKLNPDNRQITDKYDLVDILILDSSELNTIKKINPDIIEDFKDYSNALAKKNNYKSYKTDETDIKQIFINYTNQKQLIKFLYPESEMTISFPIYIKGNKVIFHICTKTWSATYFAKLENKEITTVKLGEGTDFIDFENN